MYKRQVDTLAYLYRGGRCNAVAAMAGGVLKLHPRIVVEDGAMNASKTVSYTHLILEHKLPTVLTASEIDRLLDAVDDIKYKAMFAVMYLSLMHI